MKNLFLLNNLNGFNKYYIILLVLVLGLLVPSDFKNVILLSIFIIYISLSLTDLFIHNYEFYSNLLLKILEIYYNKNYKYW
jgi:hypothetical protein